MQVLKLTPVMDKAAIRRRWLVATSCTWPQDEGEQIHLLQSMHPLEWGRIPGPNLNLILRDTYSFIATHKVETHCGSQIYYVWTCNGSNEVLIVKEAILTSIMVSCVLTSVENKLEASFHLLSGLQFYTRLLETKPALGIWFGALKEAAHEEALKHGLLDSKYQEMQLVLQGLGSILPDEIQVWKGGPSTNHGFEDALTQLSKLREPALQITTCVRDNIPRKKLDRERKLGKMIVDGEVLKHDKENTEAEVCMSVPLSDSTPVSLD